MADIYEDIRKWLSQPENDNAEKRAKLLIKTSRLIYDFAKDKCCEPGERERHGLANILEAIEDYRTDMFVEQRRNVSTKGSGK